MIRFFESGEPMLFLRKLLKLPTPVDLGWSKTNALALEDFNHHPDSKTWEDWHRTVKEMHPIRYWIAETAADEIRYSVISFFRPLETLRYWFVSHFIPSRRYHMLDLRQPRMKGDKNSGYRYGWQDVPEKMLYAMFNLLGEYLNKEQPVDLTLYYTHEQIEDDPHLKAQQKVFEEANSIYYWWTKTRHEENAHCDKLLNDWYEAHKNKEDSKDELHTLLENQEKLNEEKIDEMISRLVKIRRNLWT